MRNFLKLIAPSALVLTIALGATGAYAYYTAQTETALNTFNVVAGGGGQGMNGGAVGTVDETFDPTEARDLEPRATFTKKAKVNSNVDYSSYAYMLVTIPNVNARLSGESSKSYQDALTLNFDQTNWTEVKQEAGSSSAPSKYLYRYKTILASGAETSDLFTTATVPDFIESEGVSGTIDVTGYMLSSVNVDTSEADADAIVNFFS